MCYHTYKNMDYIDKLRQHIISTISQERYEHTMRTEQVAISIAERFGYRRELLSAAALWHDVARRWSEGELLDFIEKHKLIALPYEFENPMLLHGLAGAQLFNQWDSQMPFDESEIEAIWRSIRWHTTGHVEMGEPGYILFIADYIEPGRTHLSDDDKDRIYSLPSLQAMVRLILEMQFSYFSTKGVTDIGPGRELYEKMCRECSP